MAHQVKGRLLLDVVIRESSAIFKLLSSEDQTLLVRGDALLVLVSMCKYQSCSNQEFGKMQKMLNED